MRKIHLANEKKRDAEIGFEPGKKKEPVAYVLADGRQYSGARLLKSTIETEPESLANKYPDLATAIEQGDPEVDMELVGRKLEGLSKVYLLPPAICDIAPCRPTARLANMRAVSFVHYPSLFHKPLNLARMFIGLFVIVDGNEQ